MPKITKAVILAGGKATRLYPTTQKIPKVLLKIGEKPILEHQLALLKKYGIGDVWILVGYLGDKVKEYIGYGKKWNLRITWSQENEDKLLGTAGALKQLEGKIKTDFLVFSGDVMLDFDISRLINFHKKKRGIATLIVHPSDHPFDSDLVEIDQQGRVISLLKRPHPEDIIFRNLGIASIYVFSPKVFKYIPRNKKTDFEKDILPKVIKSGQKVYAYNTPEYIKDMGTPKRLKQVNADYASGKIKKMNLQNKRKAVFLDRDGVINEEVDQLSKLEDFKLYNFAAKAIKKINKAGYLAILITNQPQIAKGFMTEETLDLIHKKLETELAKEGAKLDAIYYCPHHPEKGFEGERPELKINCQCRKPGAGLFFQARNDFNIDLAKSFVVGDQTQDILAGKKARSKTILVETGYKGIDNKYSVKPDFRARNLSQAADIIIAKIHGK